MSPVVASTPRAPSRIDVARILKPASVAVIGASEDAGKFGGRVMFYLTKHGFGGRIVPVNPNRQKVFEIPCVASIDVAGAVDVALLALPPQRLLAALQACADAGVGACVVMTTGFAEAGEEGAVRQAQLVALARTTGMRIIGPNCMGLIAPLHGMALCSSLVLDAPALRRGEIGLISQSGALMVSMYNRADDAGIGFSACVSLGNQADLEICDFLEYLVEDAQTRAICLYVEGLVDTPRFLALARRARRAGKPLLAVKTGRTPAGVKSARSHTASLAGAYAVFASACRSHGVILLDDPDGMLQLADCLLRWGPLHGDGVAVLSSSGGGAGIGVDRLGESGIRLAALAPATCSALREVLLPPQADNPIDLGGRTIADPFEGARRSLEAMAADPDVALLWMVLTTTPFYEATTRVLAEAAVACGKPFLFVVTPGSAADGPRRVLRELGCPYFDRFDDCIRIISGAVALFAMAAVNEAPPVRPAIEAGGLPAGRHADLTEIEVKRWLAHYGIPVTAEQLAANPDEAVAAAKRIGFPVVLKAVARGLLHKSDIGVVRLDVHDEAAVRDVFQTIAGAVTRHAPETAFEGCVVAQQWRPEAELIVGIQHDPQCGPVVLVGAGGVLVELISDVQMRLAPCSAGTAMKMLRALSVWPILAGYRGRPGLDVTAAAQAIAHLSWLAADHAPRLLELDVNPLGVGIVGQGVMALDARARLAVG